MPLVNDVHSRLNATQVTRIAVASCVADVQEEMVRAREHGVPICVAGGRHAMGGQQFGEGCVLLDTRGLNGFVGFDRERGLLEVEAGADWPTIIRYSHEAQQGAVQLGIRQKQTGADDLTLGGSLSANIHGRGLDMAPIVADVEALTLVNPAGELVRCSRRENADLFALCIGGYGLFGVIVRATLRLGPRLKLRRRVDILDIDDAPGAVRRRMAEGCIYGDFQYAIDPEDRSFLRRGVLCCYEPAPESTISGEESDLSPEHWNQLLYLAHTDKTAAFDLYARHYLATHGRVYWSDTMQLSTYIPTYAEYLASRLPTAGSQESLVIGEMQVPYDGALAFMERAREVLRAHQVEDIYGTIRLIRRDAESYLPWASGDFVCVIFNLRTRHTPEDVERTARAFRGLIDGAAALGGTYFPTYHRWASREQVLKCHPRLPALIAEKRARDPEGVLQSEWFRHYERMFAS